MKGMTLAGQNVPANARKITTAWRERPPAGARYKQNRTIGGEFREAGRFELMQPIKR